MPRKSPTSITAFDQINGTPEQPVTSFTQLRGACQIDVVPEPGQKVFLCELNGGDPTKNYGPVIVEEDSHVIKHDHFEKLMKLASERPVLVEKYNELSGLYEKLAARVQTLELANAARGGGDRTPPWFHWAKPIWNKLRLNPSHGVETVEEMIRAENEKLPKDERFDLPNELARAIRRQLTKGI